MMIMNLKTSVKVDSLLEESIREQISKAVLGCFSKRENQLIFCLEDEKRISFTGGKGEETAIVEIKAYDQLSETDCNRFAVRVSEIIEKELGIKKADVFVMAERNVLWAKNGSNQAFSNNYVPVRNGTFIRKGK